MRNIRIGVVEDDPASCQLVLDYLNRYQQENGEQFTVSVFDDGARIVEKYTPVYDILLLDIEMSEMDGMAAARRIRERDDKVVIVFITAAPQYAISGYEVRALSYLLKPLPWFAFSQELKKSIDMVRRNGDDSMLIETGNGDRRTRGGRTDEGLHAPVEQGVEGVDGLLTVSLVVLGLADKRQLLSREILAAKLDSLCNGLAVGRVGAGQRADGADLKRSVARRGTAVAAVGGAAS